MRIHSLMVTALFILLYGVTAGSPNLCNAPPARIFTTHETSPTEVEKLRQGGDTWEEAVLIPGVPFLKTGTTIGYSTNCCCQPGCGHLQNRLLLRTSLRHVCSAVTAEPASMVWLWVGPTTFTPPNYPTGYEYDYLLPLVGLMPGMVPVQKTTWTEVKILYRLYGRHVTFQPPLDSVESRNTPG